MCTLIGSKLDKLLIVGGQFLDIMCAVATVKLFDLELKSWTDLEECKNQRSYGGIYYDEIAENVFIAGGTDAEQKVEYYDINQGKWFELNDLCLEYDYYPAI